MKYRLTIFLLFAVTTSFAQFRCSNGNANPVNPTKGILLKCTTAHQEFLPAPPVTLTRVFGLYIPPNYVPCDPAFPTQPCSGTILKIQGTTHKIVSDCSHTTIKSENQGWLWFLDNLPAPAPVLVCPEGLFDQLTTTVTDPGERWNSWSYGNRWNWRAVVGSDKLTYSGNTQVKPNDEDFLVTLVRNVQSTLLTDTKFSVVTNDWVFTGNMVAYQLAALHPDLFNAVTVFGDPFGSNWTGNLATGYTDVNGPIPLPAAPISVLIITGLTSGGEQVLCGALKNHANMGIVINRPYTIDDTLAYWNTANQPDQINYYPPVATKFCGGIGMSIRNQTGVWRYAARNSVTGALTEAWNLYMYHGSPFCSFGPDGNVITGMCAATNPPIDWRLWNTSLHYPGNPYADSVLGYSLLQIEWNFMQRARK